jgi:hypothetical protein
VRRHAPAPRRPRRVGNPLRAALFIGAIPFLLFDAYWFFRWSLSSAEEWSIGLWPCLGGAALFAYLAREELRLPIRIAPLRLGAAPADPRAPKRWHPRVAGLVQELRQRTRYTRPNRYSRDEVVASHLEIDDAPFRTGAPARMTFAAAAQVGHVDAHAVRFHLRCLREVPKGAGWFAATSVECLAELIPSRSRRSQGRELVCELVFDLPAGLPGADVGAWECVYWELEASIDGLDVSAVERFFLPVVAADRDRVGAGAAWSAGATDGSAAAGQSLSS